MARFSEQCECEVTVCHEGSVPCEPLHLATACPSPLLFVRSAVVLRWLLPLLAVVTLLGSSVTAWAAAGFVGDASCCCPDPKTCKCHDHDGKPEHAPTLKRCAGDAVWVAPAVTPAVEAAAVPSETDVAVAVVATDTCEAMPESPTSEPETPPF